MQSFIAKSKGPTSAAAVFLHCYNCKVDFIELESLPHCRHFCFIRTTVAGPKRPRIFFYCSFLFEVREPFIPSVRGFVGTLPDLHERFIFLSNQEKFRTNWFSASAIDVNSDLESN